MILQSSMSIGRAEPIVQDEDEEHVVSFEITLQKRYFY